MRSFQLGSIQATKTGIAKRPIISVEAWLDGCIYIADAARGLPWLLGDWLNALRFAPEFSGLDDEVLEGNSAFQEALDNGFKRLMGKTGYSDSSLREFRRVSRNVSVSERFPKLTFSHYSKVLASIENPARRKWAVMAIKKEWTANQLAEEFHERQARKNVEALKESAKKGKKKSGSKEIGAPSKEEKKRVDDMVPVDEPESGLSWMQLKKIIGGPDVQFRVVLTGVTRAVSNPDFLAKQTKQEAKKLLMKLQDLESLVESFLKGEKTDEVEIEAE